MAWARSTTVGVALLAALHLVAVCVCLARAPTTASWVALVLATVVVSLSSGLSVLVARRSEGAVVAVMLGLVSLAVAHVAAKEVWLQWLAAAGRPENWAWLVAATAENVWWVLATFGLLLLVFPDGRLPSRRWRWVPPALVFSAGLVQAYGAFEAKPFRPPLEDLDRPFGPPPAWLEIGGLVFFPMLALFVACAVSIVMRYRHSDAKERHQIKWLALAGIGMPLYPLLCLLEIWIWGEAFWVSAAVGIASLVATPVAAGVAVLRHDLYDVDKALALAATWGLLTALLLAVYAAVSSIVGLAIGRDSHSGVAVGTAAAAVVLLPGLRVIRGAIEARTYPLRRAALTAVDHLHREVSGGRARPEELQKVLREGLRDPRLRVGFRVPGSQTYLDAEGASVPADGVAVVLDNEQTGVVVPGSGTATAELLREVADRCSTLVEVIRLRSQVALALREAQSSRTRLLEIGYEERRRIERDLHDGAQQRLVSLGMQLRLAQRHLNDGTVDVDRLFDQSVAELGTAVAELRQIAHGLRPSSLDDGLPAALSNLVRSLPLTVDIDIDDSPLPDAVATTAYYVASEAITNAVKHADATRIVLEVVRRDGHLLVRVTDDGRGGAQLGVLSGLTDRVAALGGSLQVASPRGEGTKVEAALPCAS